MSMLPYLYRNRRTCGHDRARGGPRPSVQDGADCWQWRRPFSGGRLQCISRPTGRERTGRTPLPWGTQSESPRHSVGRARTLMGGLQQCRKSSGKAKNKRFRHQWEENATHSNKLSIKILD